MSAVDLGSSDKRRPICIHGNREDDDYLPVLRGSEERKEADTGRELISSDHCDTMFNFPSKIRANLPPPFFVSPRFVTTETAGG